MIQQKQTYRKTINLFGNFLVNKLGQNRLILDICCYFSSNFWNHSVSTTLRKICQNTGSFWPECSRIRTKSKILSLYGNIQVSENPYSDIFYAKLIEQSMLDNLTGFGFENSWTHNYIKLRLSSILAQCLNN